MKKLITTIVLCLSFTVASKTIEYHGDSTVYGTSMTGSGAATRTIGAVFKNGTEYKRGSDGNFAIVSPFQSTATCLAYLNGTTDYAELFGFVVEPTTIISANPQITYLQATLNSTSAL